MVKPKLAYSVVLFIDVLLFIGIWKMAKDSLIDKKWWNYLILPVFFSNSLLFFSLLIPRTDVYFLEALFILCSLFLYFFLRSVYYHLVLPTAERRISLENISTFGNYLAFYFLASAVYGLQSFLNTAIWPLVIIILLAGLFLSYQIVWASRANEIPSIIYSLAISLVLAEIAWAMFYLPFNFKITGASLAIDYYVLSGLLRTYLRGNISAKVVKLYLGFGFISLFIILITARWL